MTDFSYSKIDGMFAIYANNNQSSAAISEIMSQNQNSTKFLPFEFQSLKHQLKSAGYTLSKEISCKMTVDELLEALAA